MYLYVSYVLTQYIHVDKRYTLWVYLIMVYAIFNMVYAILIMVYTIINYGKWYTLQVYLGQWTIADSAFVQKAELKVVGVLEVSRGKCASLYTGSSV